MNCNDFEAKLDLYLDGMLEDEPRRRATEHAGGCTACDSLVTSYQQASALLKTAVADRAAAVDVSGLWNAIDAAVGDIGGSLPQPLSRPLADTSWVERMRSWVASWPTITVGATAAAAVTVALFFGGLTTENPPQRIARVKSKPVSIENLEVPSGYTVSTWSRPRTRTHIIAINQAPTYTLASAATAR